jgi:hypothetical protein
MSDTKLSNNGVRWLRRSVSRSALLVGCGALICAAIFWAWYLWLADYGYPAVAGTYVYQTSNQKAVLVLFQNRWFEEQLTTGDRTEKSRGSWERSGEAGIAFSPGFLSVHGQRIAKDGHAWGQVRKTFGGLHQSIVFPGDDGDDGPVFSKRMFQ